MEETYELRSKLCDISTKIEEYKTAHKDILTTKEEYIALREECPEKKSEKEPKKPIRTNTAKIIILSILLACLAFAGFACLVGVSTVLFWFVSVPALAFCFISLLLSFISALLLLGEIIYTNIAKKKYNLAVKTCQENRNFNENEYPALKERYEKVSLELASEYEKHCEAAKAHIDSIEAYFKENSGVINKKYYQDIDRIITALDEQRANKLSDAINLVLRDKRIERTSGKQKKLHVHEEGLYPQDIMERAKVTPSNCSSCPRKESCVRLFCQMNDFFKKKKEIEDDAQLKIKELPIKAEAVSEEKDDACACNALIEAEENAENIVQNEEAQQESVVQIEQSTEEEILPNEENNEEINFQTEEESKEIIAEEK